ncbi:MAG: hypothetical protein ACFFD4_15185 [Candidatus Odinarchaeota archaeon]
MADGTSFSEVFDDEFLDELMNNTENLIKQAKVPSAGQFNQKFLLHRRLAEILIILGTRLSNQDFLDRGEAIFESLNDPLRADGYRKIGETFFTLEGDYDLNGEEYLKKSIKSWQLAIRSPEKLNEEFQLFYSQEFVELLKILKKNNLFSLLDSIRPFIPDYINVLPLHIQPSRIQDIAETMIGIADNYEIKAYLTRAEQIRMEKGSKLQKVLSGSSASFEGYFELQTALATATRDENRLRTALQQVKSASGIEKFFTTRARLNIVYAFTELGNHQEADNLLTELVTETVNEWDDGDKDHETSRSLTISKAVDIAESCVTLKKNTFAEPLIPILEAVPGKREDISCWQRRGLLFQLVKLPEQELRDEIAKLLSKLAEFCEPGDSAEKVTDETPFDQKTAFYGIKLCQELVQARTMAQKTGLSDLVQCITDSVKTVESRFTKRMGSARMKHTPHCRTLFEGTERADLLSIQEAITRGDLLKANNLLENYENQLIDIDSRSESDPGIVHQKILLANTYFKLGKFEQARELFREIQPLMEEDKLLPQDQMKQIPAPFRKLVVSRTKIAFLLLEAKIQARFQDNFDPSLLIEQFRDLDFTGNIFELGMAFLEAGNVFLTERILDEALPEEATPEDKLSFLQLSRILRMIGEREEAITALRLWSVAAKKIPAGYQLFGVEFNPMYLEELLFSGELEQVKNLITSYLDHYKRDFPFSTDGSFLDVLCREQPPEGMNRGIWQDARDFSVKLLDSQYQDFQAGKIEFNNFHQVITFVKDFIKLHLLDKADEIGIGLLLAVQQLVDDHLDPAIQERIKRHSSLTTPVWHPELLLKLLKQDPRNIPAHLSPVDAMDAEIASITDSKAQERHHRYDFSRVYRQLITVFEKTSNSILVATCKENQQVLDYRREVKLERKTLQSLLNEARQELKSRNYLMAKKLLQESFDNLSETAKVNSDQISRILSSVDLLARS